MKEQPWEALAVFTDQDRERSPEAGLDTRLEIYSELRRSIWDAVETGNAALVDDYLLVLQFMKTAMLQQACERRLNTESRNTLSTVTLEKTPQLV